MPTYPNPQNQGTALLTVTFPEFYDIVEKRFVELSNMLPHTAEQLFIVDDMPNPAPNQDRIDEYDIDTYATRKPEGQGTDSASVGVGYNVTMVPLRFGKKITVSYEDRRHNRNRLVAGRVTSLAHMVPNRINRDLTHIITFGTATSYTSQEGETITTAVGDTLSLFSTVHTLKHSSTTYSNRVSGDPLPSKGALEAAEALASTEIMNNFGQQRTMKFNKIYCGKNPTVINMFKRLLGSMSDDTQSNSGVKNVYSDSGYQLVVLHELATTATGAIDSTKKNWWGIVAAGEGEVGNRWQAYLKYWDRPSLVSPDEGLTKDGDKDLWEFHTRGYYGIRVVSGRGIIASCPTS